MEGESLTWKAIELIKKKKHGQDEEKTIQICEVLDSLKESFERNGFGKVYKNNKCSYHMLKDVVVEDKEDVVKVRRWEEDIEGEKNIWNGIGSGLQEVTTTTINMGSQTDILISSRAFQDFKAEIQQKIAKLRREFAKSRATRACVPTWSTYQRAFVPAWFTSQRVCVPAWFTCQRACVPSCQNRASFSFLRANVPINVLTCHVACQFFNLACQRAKRRANFSDIPLTKCLVNFLDFIII